MGESDQEDVLPYTLFRVFRVYLSMA